MTSRLILSSLFSLLILFNSSAEAIALPLRPQQCVNEVIWCEETDFDWATHECILTCAVTHHCATGPSYSFLTEVRENCSHQVASADSLSEIEALVSQ